jgi:predicted ATP-grasp superfamily ATP-dependent carboligase
MYPIDFGNSSYMVSIPIENVSHAAVNLRRLLGEIDYRGIFSAEFKYDARDRQFKILEINARPWWYVEFASVCGVDVCSLAYRDALGRKSRSIRNYRTSVKSVHPYFDLYACLEQLRRKELTIRQWAGSWIGAQLPVLCSDDPFPGLAWWIGRTWCKISGSNDLQNKLNL